MVMDQDVIIQKYNPKAISSPLDAGAISALSAGDIVTLSGVVLTARDQAHQRICRLLDGDRALPVGLEGQTIYYAGPAPGRPGLAVGSVGPTTAARMDAFAPKLLDHGVKAMIGKGRRSKDVVDAIVRNQAVYLVATGGAAAYLAKFVLKAEVVAFEELGPEAVYRLEVEGLPLVVAIDSQGRSGLWPDFS